MRGTKAIRLLAAALLMTCALAASASAQSRLAGRGSLVKIDENGKIIVTPVNGQNTEVHGPVDFTSATVTGLTAGEVPSLDAAKIATGIFAVARLGSGTPSISNFLRGDGTFSNVLSGGATIGTDGTALTRVIHGTCTLSSGACTVSTANVTANSRIFLTGQDNNVAGALRVSARSAGASFTVTSSSNTDSGVVAYQILEP